MIVKGGTAYINAGGLNLASESEQSVPGLFSELTVAMQSGKPVVIDIAGVTPAAAVLHADGSAIIADITGYSISVTSADAATVTASGGTPTVSSVYAKDDAGSIIQVTGEWTASATNGYIVPVAEDGTEVKLDLSEPFEICCRFKLNQNTGSYARMAFGSLNDWYYSPTVGVRTNNAGFCLNFAEQGKSSWQYDQYNFTPEGYEGVPVDTWLTAKVTFDGEKTYFYASDGTTEATYTVEAVPRYDSTYRFEFGGQKDSDYSISFGSTIDLSGTYLKQGTTKIWGI